MKEQLERLGHLFFYGVLKLFGLRGGYFCLYPVIFSYVATSRNIHRLTRHYLSKRFPRHRGIRLWLDTFRNVYSFGQVLVDRAWFGLRRKAFLDGAIVGRKELLDLLEEGRGAVLVTAHVGNWQTAMTGLDFLPVKVHALMQYDQFAAAKHFFDLGAREKPFEIIDIDGPFGGMIDATAALQRGEVVTIMADRHTRGTTKSVDFLGKTVRLPDAAYSLAACVGAPVVIFLAAKTGTTSYELKIWDILHPHFTDRNLREEMLRSCCRRFAGCLEEYLTLYPYQWYNFFDFWDQGEVKTPSPASTSIDKTVTNGQT